MTSCSKAHQLESYVLSVRQPELLSIGEEHAHSAQPYHRVKICDTRKPIMQFRISLSYAVNKLEYLI